jgi:hypothetical protein
MRWGYWTQMKAEEALSHLKNVVFPGLVEFAGVVARACPERSRRIESLRGRMGESTRQVEELFESLLAESFREKT